MMNTVFTILFKISLLNCQSRWRAPYSQDDNMNSQPINVPDLLETEFFFFLLQLLQHDDDDENNSKAVSPELSIGHSYSQ